MSDWPASVDEALADYLSVTLGDEPLPELGFVPDDDLIELRTTASALLLERLLVELRAWL